MVIYLTLISIILFINSQALAQDLRIYKWKEFPIRIDIRNVPENKRHIALDAINEWQKYLPIVVKNSSDSDIKINYLCKLPTENKQYVGLTVYITGENRHICKIYINPKKYYTNLEIKQIFVHELGHSLGLNHSSNYNDVMYNTVKREKYVIKQPSLITKNDLKSLTDLYNIQRN